MFLFKIIRGVFWKERNCMSQVIFELHSFSWHFFSWNGRGIWMQMKQAVDWKSILCSQLTSSHREKTQKFYNESLERKSYPKAVYYYFNELLCYVYGSIKKFQIDPVRAHLLFDIKKTYFLWEIFYLYTY